MPAAQSCRSFDHHAEDQGAIVIPRFDQSGLSGAAVKLDQLARAFTIGACAERACCRGSRPGSFAIIRGEGETIVGVAIATALMPPLAVVGYGLATWNLPVLGGALALFVTNFITIALSATAMARYYRFGHQLSSRQTWTQTGLLLLVFIAMAIPLGLALNSIAREALTVSQVRSLLTQRFGGDARVTQLDIAFDREPIVIRSVVITPRGKTQDTKPLQKTIEDTLARPVRLDIDQILLEAGAGALDAQREELRQAGDQANLEAQRKTAVANMIALITGASVDDVTIDRDHRRATAPAAPLPGATVTLRRQRSRDLWIDSEKTELRSFSAASPLAPAPLASVSAPASAIRRNLPSVSADPSKSAVSRAGG